MKRFILAASAAAAMSMTAGAGTAAACDPGMPTCGNGTVVENVEDWADGRVYAIGKVLEPVIEAIKLCNPDLC